MVMPLLELECGAIVDAMLTSAEPSSCKRPMSTELLSCEPLCCAAVLQVAWLRTA